MAIITYLVFGIISLCQLYEVSSNLTCLRCDNVAKPTACKYIDRCGPHEVCSTELMVTPLGSVEFSLGCIDKAFCGSHKREITHQEDNGNIVVNTDCCTSDLCNAAGCNQTGFPPDLGPVCHVCDLHIGSSSCPRVNQCGRDQICEIHPVKVAGSTDDWYHSGCIHTNMCNGGHTISNQTSVQSSADTCNVCCSTNVCNNQVPVHCTVIPVSTQKPVTTSTSSSHVTNQHAVTNAPHVTQHHAVTNAPHVTHLPAVTNAPHVNQHHHVTNAPHVTHLPAVTNAPHVHQHHAVTNEPHTTSSGCQYLGFTADHEYRGSCYKHEHHRMTWFDADKQCKEHGGHLVTIDNAEENNFIMHFVLPNDHSFWIGLNDQDHEDTFTWISGSSSMYRQFLPGYRDSNHRTSDCVKFILNPSSSGGIGWDDDICTDHLKSVCEIPSQTKHVSTAAQGGTSPIIHGDPSGCSQTHKDQAKKRHDILFELVGTSHCYTLVKHLYYIPQAKTYCEQNMYGHLADISDTKEQAHIQHVLNHYIHGKSAWIGLHQEGANYKSSSGATATYFNWASSIYPYHSHNHHHCVYMSVSTGKWSLGGCGSSGAHDQKRYFLCEMDHSVSLGAGAIFG